MHKSSYSIEKLMTWSIKVYKLFFPSKFPIIHVRKMLDGNAGIFLNHISSDNSGRIYRCRCCYPKEYKSHKSQMKKHMASYHHISDEAWADCSIEPIDVIIKYEDGVAKYWRELDDGTYYLACTCDIETEM